MQPQTRRVATSTRWLGRTAGFAVLASAASDHAALARWLALSCRQMLAHGAPHAALPLTRPALCVDVPGGLNCARVRKPHRAAEVLPSNGCSSHNKYKQWTQPELQPYTGPAPDIWLQLFNVLPKYTRASACANRLDAGYQDLFPACTRLLFLMLSGTSSRTPT